MEPAHHPHDIVGRIERLFLDHGRVPYESARRESVSSLEHALQSAQLAEWAGAPAPLVAAALLHDVGHALAAEAVARNDALDDRHEELAVPFLRGAFGEEVTEPIRLHVAAKRCLVRIDAAYEPGLSAASRHSLALQGGPMSDDEVESFLALPFADDALQLRRWDDLAKQAGRPTPPLEYYLALLAELLRDLGNGPRTVIGALDAA